jgi:hypothetical protein
MSAADPDITPVDIVEDIADALLDELLMGQAQGEHCLPSAWLLLLV